MISFKIGGLSISVSFWFFAAIGFFLLYGRSVLFWYLVMPIVIHELGHLIAICLSGGGVSAMRFRAFGIDMDTKKGSATKTSYAGEIFVTVAGAAVNLAAAGVLYATTYPTMRSMLLVAANLAAAAFNLLPVGNLDGGNIVRLIAERFGGVAFAYHASRLCSLLVLVPLFAAAFWLILSPEPNFTLLIVCVYLAGVVCSG